MTRSFASGNFTASQPLGDLRRNLGVGLLQKQVAGAVVWGKLWAG